MTRTAPTAAEDPPADLAVLTEGLGKTYPGGTVAVAGLDLAVRRGEVLALDTPAGLKRLVRGGPPTLETVFIQLTGKELRDQ